MIFKAIKNGIVHVKKWNFGIGILKLLGAPWQSVPFSSQKSLHSIAFHKKSMDVIALTVTQETGFIYCDVAS